MDVLDADKKSLNRYIISAQSNEFKLVGCIKIKTRINLVIKMEAITESNQLNIIICN